MSSFALSVVALLSLQVDPAEWVDRLGDPDPAVRDQAVEWLEEHGEAARARLEALRDGEDPEVAARAARILDRLERRARLLEAVGPPPSVSIAAEGAECVDLLLQVREQSGLPIRLRDVPLGRAVTVSWEARDPVDAVLDLCRLHGGIRFDPTDLVVAPGRPEPICHAARDGAHIFLVRYTEDETGQDLSFGLVWTRPTPPLQVWIDPPEVVDSLGTLRGASSGPRIHRLGSHTLRVVLERRLDRQAAWISVRGTATLRFLTGRRAERVILPGRGQVARLQGLDAYLFVEPTGSTQVQVIPAPGTEPDLLTLSITDPEGRSILASSGGVRSRVNDGPWFWVWTFAEPSFPDGSEACIEYSTGSVDLEVPFRFERVPLTAADE